MKFAEYYEPPLALPWHERRTMPEDACFYQHIHLNNLLENVPKKSPQLTFALIGFKSDEGKIRDLCRTGTIEGPTAIRQCLANLPIQKSSFICYDVGNIICTDHHLEKSQEALAEVVDLLLQVHIHPIVLGGGHELAFGHFQGIAKQFSPKKRLGIINFDSHFDLTPLGDHHLGSSATAFYQIGQAHQLEQRRFDYNCIGIQHSANIRLLFDIAKQFNTNFILADDLYHGLEEKCFDFIDRIVDQNDMIYVSLSLDVFGPAFAPGVSSIQPLGLNPWHIIPLIRQIAASGKVLSYDIAEYLPRYDIDHRTAKLAATLIYEIIHHQRENPRLWT